MTVQGPIKIASLPLKKYKPEDISLDVDGENIILHGQHRSEGEDGFENNEFKKIIKLPDGVDPTIVKSLVIKNLKSGSVLLLEGNRRVEEKANKTMASFRLNWICVDSKQKISRYSFVDMSSQSQENTNQKTKVSIFHVITAIAFCCLMT